MYVCMNVCMHVYAYIYIYIYIHTGSQDLLTLRAALSFAPPEYKSVVYHILLCLVVLLLSLSLLLLLVLLLILVLLLLLLDGLEAPNNSILLYNIV